MKRKFLMISSAMVVAAVALGGVTQAESSELEVNEQIELSTDQPTATGNYLIALQSLTDEAKALIAFQDKTGTPKAWLAAHDYLRYPGNRHRHFSIETADMSGQLQSRLEVPYDCDKCNVGTVSGSNFSVSEGDLRIAYDNSANKNLVFQLRANRASTNRWAVRVDNTMESGGSAGSDFQLVRYGDSGEALDTPLFVKRSTANVGISTRSPSARLTIKGASVNSGYILLARNSANRNQFVVMNNGNVGIGTSSPRSALSVGMTGDSVRSYEQADSESGPPPAADCDADSERGRMVHDFQNHRLYVCGGAARGWDHSSLSD
jgi:hypothetical protein